MGLVGGVNVSKSHSGSSPLLLLNKTEINILYKILKDTVVYEKIPMIFLMSLCIEICLHVCTAVCIITIAGSSLVTQLKRVFIKHHVALLYCRNNLIAHLNASLCVSLAAFFWMKQQRMRQWMSLLFCQRSPDLIYKSPVTLHSALKSTRAFGHMLCDGCYFTFVLMLLKGYFSQKCHHLLAFELVQSCINFYLEECL